MRLIVVMPTYNEAECIEKVCKKWLALVKNYSPAKLIVINDGSKDNTQAILDSLQSQNPELAVVHQPNGGHGKAVLNGYQKAIELNPEYIFQVDSDDQFIPEDFALLWQRKEESKFITGFRKQRYDEPVRLLITKILRVVIFLFFQVRIKDANIPYRLMRADFLKKIISFLPTACFAPNIFLSVLAKKSGQKLIEIPVTHQERKTGQVSIFKWKLYKVCLESLKELFFFSIKLKLIRKQLKNA